MASQVVDLMLQLLVNTSLLFVTETVKDLEIDDFVDLLQFSLHFSDIFLL